MAPFTFTHNVELKIRVDSRDIYFVVSGPLPANPEAVEGWGVIFDKISAKLLVAERDMILNQRIKPFHDDFSFSEFEEAVIGVDTAEPEAQKGVGNLIEAFFWACWVFFQYRYLSIYQK